MYWVRARSRVQPERVQGKAEVPAFAQEAGGAHAVRRAGERTGVLRPARGDHPSHHLPARLAGRRAPADRTSPAPTGPIKPHGIAPTTIDGDGR